MLRPGYITPETEFGLTLNFKLKPYTKLDMNQEIRTSTCLKKGWLGLHIFCVLPRPSCQRENVSSHTGFLKLLAGILGFLFEGDFEFLKNRGQPFLKNCAASGAPAIDLGYLAWGSKNLLF